MPLNVYLDEKVEFFTLQNASSPDAENFPFQIPDKEIKNWI